MPFIFSVKETSAEITRKLFDLSLFHIPQVPKRGLRVCVSDGFGVGWRNDCSGVARLILIAVRFEGCPPRTLGKRRGLFSGLVEKLLGAP